MPVLNRNPYVIPLHLKSSAQTHYVLSVKGLFALADAIEEDDPETARELRTEATARGIAAFKRLNPEANIE